MKLHKVLKNTNPTVLTHQHSPTHSFAELTSLLRRLLRRRHPPAHEISMGKRTPLVHIPEPQPLATRPPCPRLQLLFLTAVLRCIVSSMSLRNGVLSPNWWLGFVVCWAKGRSRKLGFSAVRFCGFLVGGFLAGGHVKDYFFLNQSFISVFLWSSSLTSSDRRPILGFFCFVLWTMKYYRRLSWLTASKTRIALTRESPLSLSLSLPLPLPPSLAIHFQYLRAGTPTGRDRHAKRFPHKLT